MSTIIAGRFQLQDEVDRARRALADAGFDNGRISGFYLSQPGQHDQTPIGGDHLSLPAPRKRRKAWCRVSPPAARSAR